MVEGLSALVANLANGSGYQSTAVVKLDNSSSQNHSPLLALSVVAALSCCSMLKQLKHCCKTPVQ